MSYLCVLNSSSDIEKSQEYNRTLKSQVEEACRMIQFYEDQFRARDRAKTNRKLYIEVTQGGATIVLFCTHTHRHQELSHNICSLVQVK